jgi:glycosyltransferase involved in cell wall biosynthesis
MTKPSVVMLIASFYPHLGGTEKQALEASGFLLRDGVGVRVVTRRLPGTLPQEYVDGVPVVRLYCPGRGIFNSLWFMVSAFAWLFANRREYDVIHVHLASSHALAACLAGKLLGRGVVIKIGGGAGIGELAVSSSTRSGRLKLKLLAWFTPRVLVVNEDLRAELAKHGLGALEVSVLPNGVDTGKYSPALFDEKRGLRGRLGLPGGTAFLFVGRLSPEKRMLEFLELWAETMREMPDCGAFLVIAGEGPLDAELRAAARALDISGSVIFAGRRDDLGDYYRACDVFVLPSVSEGLSNAMLEAMSCGMAVMATSRGGARDALSGTKAGYLFDPFDKPGIKKLLRDFIVEPRLAVATGEAARARAVEAYNMPATVRALEEVYSSVMRTDKTCAE